jgi:hypothetical protein
VAYGKLGIAGADKSSYCVPNTRTSLSAGAMSQSKVTPARAFLFSGVRRSSYFALIDDLRVLASGAHSDGMTGRIGRRSDHKNRIVRCGLSKAMYRSHSRGFLRRDHRPRPEHLALLVPRRLHKRDSPSAFRFNRNMVIALSVFTAVPFLPKIKSPHRRSHLRMRQTACGKTLFSHRLCRSLETVNARPD